MRIEHIREFLVLAEELNYTAAAKKLYLAQPALSKHIVALEDELGVRLVDRSTHSVSLTEAGLAAAERFQAVMDEYDDAVREIGLRAGGFLRQVRLGFLLRSLDDALYTATERIAHMQRDCKVEVVFKDADQLIDELVRGTIDACLLMDIRFPGDDVMVFDDVATRTRSVMVLDDDPLAQRPTLTFSDIADRTLVFPSGEGDNTSEVFAMFASRGLPKPAVAFSSQKSTQQFTMREVNGVAVVSDETHKRLPHGVRMVKLDEPDAFINLCWVYRRANGGEGLRAFLSRATAILAEHGSL